MAQEQVYIATRDIPAPGYGPDIVAFRAGDVIPPAWAEQHAQTLKDLAGDGPELVARVSPAKAGQVSERAQREQAGEPTRVQPTTP
jgi:hypothetical protein